MGKKNEAAHHCRLLSFLTLIGFSLSTFALIVLCTTTLDNGDNDPGKYKLERMQKHPYDEGRNHASMLIVLSIISILGVIASFLMLIASFTKNMWLTIPFWVFLVILMVEQLFEILFFGFCVGKCANDNYTKPLTESQFTNNILHGGGTYIFTSLTLFPLLIYVAVPSFTFFLECKEIRDKEIAKKKAAAKAKAAAAAAAAKTAATAGHPIPPAPPSTPAPLK